MAPGKKIFAPCYIDAGEANPIVSDPSAPRHNTISDYKACVKVTVVYRASRVNAEAVVAR